MMAASGASAPAFPPFPFSPPPTTFLPVCSPAAVVAEAVPSLVGSATHRSHRSESVPLWMTQGGGPCRMSRQPPGALLIRLVID